MSKLEVTHHSSASPAAVWQIMTDLDGAPTAITGIQSVHRLDAGTGFGVGTKWEETRTMFGREATETLEVTAVEEGRSYVVESDARGAHYRSALSVEPSGDGSRLAMSFEAEPEGLVSKVFASTLGKLFDGATRKAIKQDLADIASAAESA